jgi:hypothetical protein
MSRIFSSAEPDPQLTWTAMTESVLLSYLLILVPGSLSPEVRRRVCAL